MKFFERITNSILAQILYIWSFTRKNSSQDSLGKLTMKSWRKFWGSENLNYGNSALWKVEVNEPLVGVDSLLKLLHLSWGVINNELKCIDYWLRPRNNLFSFTFNLLKFCTTILLVFSKWSFHSHLRTITGGLSSYELVIND